MMSSACGNFVAANIYRALSTALLDAPEITEGALCYYICVRHLEARQAEARYFVSITFARRCARSVGGDPFLCVVPCFHAFAL